MLRLTTVLGLLFSISIFADLAPVGAVQTSGRLAVEMAERIAYGRVTEMEVIRVLGQQPGASLWAAIKGLQAQGNLPTSASDWAALRQIAATQDASGNDLIARFKGAAEVRAKVSSQSFFATARTGPARPQLAAVTESPEEAFYRSEPESATGRQLKETILASGSRAAGQRMQTIGQLLQLAKQSPGTCSTGAQAFCATAAPETVWLWAGQNLDQAGEPAVAFLTEVLTGFPSETKNYVGRNEQVLKGAFAALKQGETMDTGLKSCFWRGTPGVN